MKRLYFLTYCATLLLLISCRPDASSVAVSGFFADGYSVTYDFSKPDTTIFLQPQLIEVSGLAYVEKRKQLVAINDELGILFFLDPSTGDIVQASNFGRNGDYEGITVDEEVVYVVESNGNLTTVALDAIENAERHKSNLDNSNNIEGLALNESSETLFLAAKGDSEIDDNIKSVKSIFRIGLAQDIEEAKPFLVFDLHTAPTELTARNLKTFDLGEKSVNKRLNDFGPSGIAIHPRSEELYILSAKNNSLIISSNHGEVQAIILLDPQQHPQPEGICFDDKNNLYIANEGKMSPGSLTVYSAK